MTKFEDIYKIFLFSMQDYRISKLFQDDVQVAEDLLETFLIRAIPLFKNCVKNIMEVDFDKKEFFSKLDLQEITILSDLMLLSWMDWNINDILQMNLNLNDTDFRRFSEEKNLREKSMYADRVREKVNQDMVDYGLYRTPFKDWAGGIYDL